MSEQLKQKIFAAINEYCDANHNFGFDPKNPTIRLHEPTFSGEEINAFVDQMLSTKVTMGPEVRKFEEQYAREFGHKYGVMNNSGSSANLLAVAAIANPATTNSLKAGDEVIVPSLSWSTTVWPLIQSNLVPVFVDCDPKSFNFDLNKLEAAITPKTKAIMLVHVYGNPCDMDALMALAKKHNLQVIEDTCESMGAYYKGKAVGTFGRVATFSLYFSHHITTLEGGITVTDDFELAETMRIMRAHGWTREADEHAKYVAKYPDIDPRFIFVNLGYNLRATECQARMGQVQLPKLAKFVDQRRANVTTYFKNLSKYSDIFDFQHETPGSRSSWFGFSIVLKPNCPFSVKEISTFMKSHQIENRPIIAGNIALHPVMKLYEHKVAGDQSASTNIMKNGIAFGCHQAMDEVAVNYVCSKIDEFVKNYKK
ncbi:MAG: aminotransferase class I/II-fold pyridoxal phosphate-dependent enzyme [Alphaproteobacteria bacterium]|nr:aminotransferase class I/II-fold pyridoxal phosphate-dependent enzyme [Alphaproteobacteria bacterium]